MTALLEIENLTRDYALRGKGGAARSLRAVDDVSLDVEAGSIVAVVGESGCGKSTLARIVMALDRPTGGTVRLGGDDLFALTPKALARKRRDFQMVFQ
ncbi:peptide ABC transporter ATP-binding protein, partial [Methylobacterium frigidaeris]